MKHEMGFWVFVLDSGMPYSVEKCTFQPTIRPVRNGEWLHCDISNKLQAESDFWKNEASALKEALEFYSNGEGDVLDWDRVNNPACRQDRGQRSREALQLHNKRVEDKTK